MRKHRRDLKRTHNAESRDLSGGNASNVIALVEDAAARRAQEFREQIEAGSLPCPVGADQRMNGAALDAQIDAIDRDESREVLGQILGFEDGRTTHGY